MTGRRRKIVYVLATNYSGSHYLALMLAGHSRVAHVGELRQFWKDPTDVRLCPVCGGPAGCPLFRGLDPGRLDDVYEGLYRNVPEGTEVLVDNSKLVEWAERFLPDSRYEHRFLFLVRDPRALVRRWDRRHRSWRRRLGQRYHTLRRRPSALLPVLGAGRKGVYVHKWLNQNRAIRDFLRRRELDFRLVTYRDLARDPSSEVRRLLGWLDLELEEGQTDFWNFEHHGPQKRDHARMAGRPEHAFDRRWQQDLTAAEREWIAGHRGVRAFTDELGLAILADGLARTG